MPSQVDVDLYNYPLFYDIVFDEDTRLEADFLEAAWKRFGKGPLRRVLEPACGTGRLVEAMARRGFQVTGFDSNLAMLRFAQGRVCDMEAVRLEHDYLESFRFRQKFDLAHCLISTFKHLVDGKSAESHLQAVAQHLRSGGLYLLGLHLVDYSRQKPCHERWVSFRDGIEVVCNTRTFPPDRRRRLEALRNRLKVTLPDGSVRRYESHWNFRTYNAAELHRLLRRVPEFNVLGCCDFNYDLNDPCGLDDSQEDLVVILGKT